MQSFKNIQELFRTSPPNCQILNLICSGQVLTCIKVVFCLHDFFFTTIFVSLNLKVHLYCKFSVSELPLIHKQINLFSISLLQWSLIIQLRTVSLVTCQLLKLGKFKMQLKPSCSNLGVYKQNRVSFLPSSLTKRESQMPHCGKKFMPTCSSMQHESFKTIHRIRRDSHTPLGSDPGLECYSQRCGWART